MNKPNRTFTMEGLQQWNGHVFNIEQALFFITNHIEDLELDSDEEDILYAMDGLVEKFKKADEE